MPANNTTADDISSVIGFSATLTLCAWYGGRNLYVPLEAAETHSLVKLIGRDAFIALVGEWMGDHLSVPTLRLLSATRRDREIGEMLVRGADAEVVAEKTGLTTRRVQQIRRGLESSGQLALIREQVEAERKASRRARRPRATDVL